jgi:hypothetical protein
MPDRNRPVKTDVVGIEVEAGPGMVTYSGEAFRPKGFGGGKRSSGTGIQAVGIGFGKPPRQTK